MFRVLTLRQSNLFWSSELLCNSDKFLVLVILWFKCRIQGNFRTSLETSFLFICRILCKFFETIATACVILFISSVTSFVQNPVSVVTNSKQRHCATFWQAGSFEVQNYFLFSLQPAQNLNQFWKLQRHPYPFFSKGRPPPGFECKSPTSHHMPMLDDPGILWSKALDTG